MNPSLPTLFLINILTQQQSSKLVVSGNCLPYLSFYQTVAMLLHLSFTKDLITDTHRTT